MQHNPTRSHPPCHVPRLQAAGGIEYYRDLLSIETVATLNAAFCDHHLTHCPPSQQLLDVCSKVCVAVGLWGKRGGEGGRVRGKGMHEGARTACCISRGAAHGMVGCAVLQHHPARIHCRRRF